MDARLERDLSGAPCSSMQTSCHLFLTIYMWRRTSLKPEGGGSFRTDQVCWTPLLSRTVSHGILQRRSLNKPKSALLKSKVVILLLALLFFLRILNFTILCCHIRGFMDTAYSLSSAARALTPFWSCISVDGAGAILLVPEVTNFQPSPSQQSPFPSATSMDCASPSVDAAGGSGSSTYRILERLQSISCLPSLMLRSLWTPSCSSLSWQHGPSPAPMCCRRGARLSWAPAERPLVSPQPLATELHAPLGAHSGLRSLMCQG
ncbi:PREDICTED: uncharacterized protein LOC103924602 [Pygoscelis adeliae]|uniref:uncharacterized protein LOC103924602 n=1 Tax=Pygoscelis adeliae TaxID=9238 RepID=UPI0004F50239|nr:PREDICTED: uncharacterized protein LOC103924602 [Pygoscelis adeliae]